MLSFWGIKAEIGQLLLGGGGLLCMFWVRGRAISNSIDFYDFGIRNGAGFYDFGVRNGIDTFWGNLYKVGYMFLENL